MFFDVLELIFLRTAQIFGVFLVTYYLGMELLVFALIIKSLIVRFFSYVKSFKTRKKKSHGIKLSIKDLYQKSLFFNHTLAILLMIVIALIIAYLPGITTILRLEIFTVVVSILPYILSFTRATNVGINGGIIGTVLGLFLFSYIDPSLNWWDRAAYFLVITGLANTSGWIGGWVGPGQLREAVSATVFKVKMDKEGATLRSLVETIQNSINKIIPIEQKQNLFIDHKPTMTIAQDSNSFSIVSYRHDLEWRQTVRPQRIALKWLFDNYAYEPNIIIDYVFNLFRAKVTKIVLLSNQSNETSENSEQEPIYLIALNYKETSSIVWVDKEIEKLSKLVCKNITADLMLDEEDDNDEAVDWKIGKPIESIIREWRPKVTLEQYSKDTIGANLPYEVIKDGEIGKANRLPLIVKDEILKTPTLFDRFRGHAFAFISFMFFQVFIGIIINVLSARMGN